MKEGRVRLQEQGRGGERGRKNVLLLREKKISNLLPYLIAYCLNWWKPSEM